VSKSRTLLLLLLFSSVAVTFLFYRKGSSNDLDDFADRLQDLVRPEKISANMSILASNPHRAGTTENHEVGDRIIQQLQEMGASVRTSEYFVDLPERGTGSLTMTFPREMGIDYSEKDFPEDPYSRVVKQEKPYFAYIPDSDIEAEVIYANFGDRQDYQYLKKQGITVAGKIALVRTQGSCRGMKQMIAEEEQLAGLLLFPEIKDQGFRKVDYPAGPGINPWVAQRGSMLKFFQYPGDPDFVTEDRRENTLPTVPALPITGEAARLILSEIEGSVNPAWKGWMNVPYQSGPGPARLRIQYQSSRTRKKIRNIFATLAGSNPIEPAVMISCHYDAWIYGASDPASGTATILEASRALFDLESDGWKPKRNIIFAFWDAEEYGMIGSTQWVGENLEEARGKIATVVYVDSVRGPMFKANVLPGLRGLLDQALQRFKDPNTDKTVSEFHVQHDMPGFSDDTIPFSNLAGVPIAQLNYGLRPSMYHSIYDNLQWMEKFGDPNYSYVTNLARIIALYAIILTREDTLPFRFSEFANHYAKELSKIGLENIEQTKRLKTLRDTTRIIQEISVLGKQFENIDLNRISSDRRKRINDLLLQAVLCFTEIPNRTSVSFRLRNVITGPAIQNECAGTDMPGIRRALHNKGSNQLDIELDRFRNAFNRSKGFLHQAAALLEPGVTR
jgi:N-acetylated-alpha-linked acidic dipeptidase